VLRNRAIRAAERWIVERFEGSDGLGAIYPPMMYIIMALDLLGYPKDHPDVLEAEKQFFNLLVDDERGFYFQPCFSVVWDTGIAAYALGESGLAPRAALARAADWLLTKEVRLKGDWAVKRPDVEPSGWYFEFANEFYPDIDDTAQVLLALARARGSDEAKQDECMERAVKWLLAHGARVDSEPMHWGALHYAVFAGHGEVAKLLHDNGFHVVNLDSTVIAQGPRMAPHIPAMIANIAADLGIDRGRVNVKAKTTERLGFTGRGEGIAAQAIALVEWRQATQFDKR
jgi:hypothetical protein